MQIYEKLIFHLQSGQACWQDGEQIFFQVQITCVALKIMLW